MVRTSTKATSSDAPKRHGGRIPGAKAYHKPTLYALVSQFRPINRVMWDAVANQYRVATGELKVRDNVKRYFVQKCCNNNKKPTGQSAPDPFTEKCQQLWRSILESEDASDMGESDGGVRKKGSANEWNVSEIRFKENMTYVIKPPSCSVNKIKCS